MSRVGKDLAANPNNPPDLSAVTPKYLELFERALAETPQLRKSIEELSLKSNPTVRDLLCLALYRHQLSFYEPQLPVGVPLTPSTLWQYWAKRKPELQAHQAIQQEILSYLMTDKELESHRQRSMLKELEFVEQDQMAFVAMYPIIEQRYRKKRGAPATKRPIAAKALQMQLDKKLSLARVTPKVCECGKATHDNLCENNLEKSIKSLRKLLRRFGIQVSKP
jgi:hypothetical protein